MSLAHRDDYYETPLWLYYQIEEETGLKFDLDICASQENKKCPRWMSEDYDILKHPNDNYVVDSIWCNPPRSKNGKFVNFIYKLWQEQNHDIVMLLCWNDLGNKYGEKLLPHILKGEIIVGNLGKIKFDKNGVETQYPSRLTYFWAWFKKRNT